MKQPNFFIVGAPKCGTTSLFHYLKQHPDIFMPEIKELHYFATDLTFINAGSKNANTLEEYLTHFEPAQHEARVGEASACQLFSHDAAHRIKAFAPDAKIIITLRNPADMIWSLYEHRKFAGREDAPTVEAALALENDRKQGLHRPEEVGWLEGMYYRSNARFSSYVKHYLEVFGTENVKVILLEELKNDAATIYRELLQFLEVDDTFTPDLSVRNKGQVDRSFALRKTLRKPPRLMKMAGKILPSNIRHRLVGKIVRMNTTSKSSLKMEDTLRQKLLDEYQPEIEQLAQLIQKNLAILWR